MPSVESSGKAQLYTRCRLCKYPFKSPQARDVCEIETACAKRLSDPSYRVPPGRLSGVEERVREYLIEQAKKTDPDRPFQAKITYGDLCNSIDPEQHFWSWPRFRGVGSALGRISTFEHEQGRPMLSALVVQAGTLHAGDGFAGLGRNLGIQIQPGGERAFWRGQLEEVVRYWTAHEKETPVSSPTERALALLAAMSEDLQEVRRLLGGI
jgi:hypothetical protein